MPLLQAPLAARARYLSTATSLSRPRPERPCKLTGVKVGDTPLACVEDWEKADLLALLEFGGEPGLPPAFTRHAPRGR